MYEWLASELQLIATRKFHQVDGAAVDDFRDVVDSSGIALPEDYKAFVLEFGNAKFFRQSLDGYKMAVLAGPRRIKEEPGWFCVGFLDGNRICMREGEPGVFGKTLKKQLAPSFEGWLAKTYDSIKAKYPKKEWKAIIAGPRPFDAGEASMLEARGKFVWRDLGADSNHDRLIEVENRSERTIARFTLGARSLDRRLNGGLILHVAGISPGSKAVLTHSCYKKFYPSDQIELFDLPRPGPEDRKYYAEFK